MIREEFGTNTASLYHRMHYNWRGQLFDIWLGTSNDTNLDLEDPAYWSFTSGGWNRGALRLYFSAGLKDYNSVNPSQPDNNGNIHRMDHFVPTALGGSGNITSWVMGADGYAYNQLDRLMSVIETLTGGSGLAIQEYYTSSVIAYDLRKEANSCLA